MNGRPILTLVLAPRRPVPKPSSTGFPLSFGTGSNGMRNMNQGMRGMPQPPPRREPSMEATLGPYTQSVVSAIGIGCARAAPTVPGSMASGKDPHDTTFSRIHTPARLISTRERVIEPKNERQTHFDARAGPKTPRTETPQPWVPAGVWYGLQRGAEHRSNL